MQVRLNNNLFKHKRGYLKLFIFYVLSDMEN